MAKKDGTPDLRIKRTQQAIKAAFFELIEAQGFEHITVKDITDKAMISRNTFYLHYNDKFDLFDKICDELTRKLFFGVGRQLRLEQRSLDVDVESAARVIYLGINTIEEDREAYRVLINSSGANLLTEKITAVIRRALDLVRESSVQLSDYSVEYIVSGMMGVIKYHVNHPDEDFRIDVMNFAKVHLGCIAIGMRESNSEKDMQVSK